jgi:hypothetical protein
MKRILPFLKWNSINEEQKIIENELSQILESQNPSEEEWYQFLDQSYEAYKQNEERDKNPDGRMQDGQKFWIFEYPIHEIMRKTGCISILESLTLIMQKFGYGESVDLMHYMMNDFSLEWENSYNGTKPKLHFIFEGPSDNHIDDSGTLNVGDPNSPRKTPALTIKIFSKTDIDFNGLGVGIPGNRNNTSICVFPEVSSGDIPDVLIDIYKIVKQVNTK